MESLVKWSLAIVLLSLLRVGSSAKELPVSVTLTVPAPPGCADVTPHKEMWVQTDNGVQLQVLDWGGADKSRTMVLITGLGDNAHVYDQFAFQFTDFFHVIGITRRGYLPSSQPPGSVTGAGYDLDTRARDDVAVLDFLGISKAVFVGHSVASSELSTLGMKYANRVDKLVYLDAFDLSKRFQLPDVPPPPYTEADNRSLQILLAANQRLENILRPAQAVCIAVQFDPNGVITDSTTPGSVPQAILLGVQTSPPTDWTEIEAPRLGIFDRASVEGKLPYYWYLNAKDRKQFDENWPGIVQWYTDRIREFAASQPGKPRPIVYTLPDAPHYFYFNDQAFVVRVMREFLLHKDLPR
jgi:pimeloyl-ACP methyl ester carboxylesterase